MQTGVGGGGERDKTQTTRLRLHSHVVRCVDGILMGMEVEVEVEVEVELEMEVEVEMELDVLLPPLPGSIFTTPHFEKTSLTSSASQSSGKPVT